VYGCKQLYVDGFEQRHGDVKFKMLQRQLRHLHQQLQSRLCPDQCQRLEYLYGLRHTGEYGMEMQQLL
jgi:hypothetical protein